MVVGELGSVSIVLLTTRALISRYMYMYMYACCRDLQLYRSLSATQ